ncbi:MAG: hypothetical protein DRQ47_09620, partial [Gammaproteobacteria bacterium]
MSEILIIAQQSLQLPNNGVVQSSITDQFVDSLRVGQTLIAQLLIIKDKYYLQVDGAKIAIPKEMVKQWQLQQNQTIRLKVRSLDTPVQLQIVDKPIQSQPVPAQSKPTQPLPTQPLPTQPLKNAEPLVNPAVVKDKIDNVKLVMDVVKNTMIRPDGAKISNNLLSPLDPKAP